MSDKHDEAARVGCPKCHGSGFTSPRGYSTADPKPCPECKRVAALLREVERTAVNGLLGLLRLIEQGALPEEYMPLIRSALRHFEEGDHDAR